MAQKNKISRRKDSQVQFSENLLVLCCNFSIPAQGDDEKNYLDFLKPWY